MEENPLVIMNRATIKTVMEAGATIQVGAEAVLTEDSVAADSEEEVPVAGDERQCC